MTTQPKSCRARRPECALPDNIEVNVRLVDCVGYMVDGAAGHLDGEKPRMVRTPWSEEEIPFTEAAEIGTKKVITEHATVGVVMTSDGSIATELPRSAYVPAEERAVNELKSLGKPFVIVVNSTMPASAETVKLAESLTEKYGATAVPMDVLHLSEQDIVNLFEKLLMEFPLRRIDFKITKWLQALPADNAIIADLKDKICAKAAGHGRACATTPRRST